MGKHFKLNMIALAISMGVAGAASAQVYGGGATLPEKLYKGATGNPGLFQGLPNFTDFVYSEGIGSGGGKSAFATNDSNFIYPGVTPKVPVAFAGSDSVIDDNYVSTYNARGWGRLIQIPAAGTSVTLPFNKTGGGELSLTNAQICQIFAGLDPDWNVVYRAGSSGTTELLTRFLTSICAGQDLSGSNLVNGAFSTNSTFESLFTSLPSGKFVVASGSGNVVPTVDGGVNRIGYVSPDYIVDLADATKVAKVNGNLPTTANAGEALGTALAPPLAQRVNPVRWVPTFDTAPTVGYPIVGYTNFLVGQCYQDQATEDRIKALVKALADGDFDAKTIAHSFVPLPEAFRNAINDTFVTNSINRGLDIGNTSACGANGRPATASAFTL
ncbi:substrate-binding domain-containing protein [Pollutimonas bauzanensis]|uniref:Phosphate ABC transporter substrate-binding protein, PhoT family n=1 Tax=Pollutimonas bauzanensis TaxID=658167 RepID=A0A1M6BF23_9BURK|nr:substrate-binding domain-containing protein [Pollutimonas bauzanensis]SHI47053.1 phosphate ABC transporter substrate-binding protein, PhoT family [Pollutimonas bauzanensis]